MSHGSLAVVEEWLAAVDAADAARLRRVTAERVEIVGPRGAGPIDRGELTGWLRASGFSATSLRWFCGGDGTVVVEQDAAGPTRHRRPRGNARVASRFRVDGGSVAGYARHDDGLAPALAAAGLTEADEVLDLSFERRVADRLAALPGVVAVALGGSRGTGTHGPHSDWDFAVYYRGNFDPADLRAVGWPGEVSELGGWGGGVFNGGAWLTVEGRKVDVHYRDLDDVEHHLAEARAGRFRVENLLFYLAGVPTYVVVAELAANRVLRRRPAASGVPGRAARARAAAVVGPGPLHPRLRPHRVRGHRSRRRMRRRGRAGGGRGRARGPGRPRRVDHQREAAAGPGRAAWPGRRGARDGGRSGRRARPGRRNIDRRRGLGAPSVGRWVTMDGCRTTKTSGEYTRDARYIATRITEDGRDGYPVEPGRYRLVAARACPWASRAIIVRRLLGLSDVLSLGLCGPTHDERSWTFDLDPGGRDPVLGIERLQEAYFARTPGYERGITVPAIVDVPTGKVVTNDFAQITLDLSTQWQKYHRPGAPRLYPERLRAEIDEVNDVVYPDVNNGVYRCRVRRPRRRRTTAAYHRLFARLDWLSERLAGQRYLVGDTITEADVRLFTTLVRFDAVYHGHFKCNRHKLTELPVLWAYARDLFQTPGFGDTVDFGQIKEHYYVVHRDHQPDRDRAGGSGPVGLAHPARPRDARWPPVRGRHPARPAEPGRDGTRTTNLAS